MKTIITFEASNDEPMPKVPIDRLKKELVKVYTRFFELAAELEGIEFKVLSVDVLETDHEESQKSNIRFYPVSNMEPDKIYIQSKTETNEEISETRKK